MGLVLKSADLMRGLHIDRCHLADRGSQGASKIACKQFTSAVSGSGALILNRSSNALGK